MDGRTNGRTDRLDGKNSDLDLELTSEIRKYDLTRLKSLSASKTMRKVTWKTNAKLNHKNTSVRDFALNSSSTAIDYSYFKAT